MWIYGWDNWKNNRYFEYSKLDWNLHQQACKKKRPHSKLWRAVLGFRRLTGARKFFNYFLLALKTIENTFACFEMSPPPPPKKTSLGGSIFEHSASGWRTPPTPQVVSYRRRTGGSRPSGRPSSPGPSRRVCPPWWSRRRGFGGGRSPHPNPFPKSEPGSVIAKPRIVGHLAGPK